MTSPSACPKCDETNVNKNQMGHIYGVYQSHNDAFSWGTFNPFIEHKIGFECNDSQTANTTIRS